MTTAWSAIGQGGHVELIVGDANQLNPANRRYIVNVSQGFPNPFTNPRWLEVSFFRMVEGVRTPFFPVEEVNTSVFDTNIPIFRYTTFTHLLPTGEELYMGLNWRPDFMFSKSHMDVQIFSGLHESAAAAMASTNITNQVWYPNANFLHLFP
jgi:hypothetical protein